MTITAVSTNYLGTALLPAVAQADTQLSQLEVESTTGQYANLGLQLGESSGYELSLRNTDDLLQTLTTSNAIASGRLSTASDALSTITSSAQTALASVIAWTPDSTTGTDLAATGDEALQSLVTMANSSYDDQYVFAGINTGSAPMATYSSGSASQTALVDAFETQFGFLPTDAAAQNVSAADMTNFLSGAFATQFSGSNWTSNWSSASSTDEATQISPGQTAETSASLNSGGFQQLSEAFSMLSLFGGGELSSSATQVVVNTATTLINQGLTAITNIGSNVGQAQAQVTQANDEMSTQMNLMKTQIGNLDNVDASTVATELNTLSTQLETAYQVTAQLQKLSLAQYLPT
jgi:flagellar hook-associated protein 3 FlgL